ncbi:MAG: c-type cytochrome [Chitinophagales bacterium]
MRKITLCLLPAIFTIIIVSSCSDSTEKSDDTTETKAMTNDEMVARGKYIVTASGCNDCHSPKTMTEQGPVPDMSKMLSGHPAGSVLPPYDKAMVGQWILFSPDLTAYVGPWGVSYSANLTPSESGIGTWTEEIFMNAIRNGKHLGMDNQRPIMPPMPWQEIRNLTDDDLKSIYAFLKTIPPVDNVVPAYEPPM